jgi:hypothetical protein
MAHPRVEPPAPDWCFDVNDAGQPSSCVWNGTAWHKTYEGGTDGTGVPGSFGAMFVLVLLVGVAMFAWRISLARRVARDTGLDPDQATELAILGDHGLEAGYLAGQLRRQPTPGHAEPAVAAPRSVETRLRELEQLRAQGLVTPEEHDARRRAILDTL